MISNVDVVYRDVDASPALTEKILKKFEKLQRFADILHPSRVVLDAPHNHKQKGKLFRASIEIAVSGNPIAVRQDDTSVHIAVRDAFAAIERRIKKESHKRRELRH